MDYSFVYGNRTKRSIIVKRNDDYKKTKRTKKDFLLLHFLLKNKIKPRKKTISILKSSLA